MYLRLTIIVVGVLLMLTVINISYSKQNEPVLYIASNSYVHSFSRSDLLSMKILTSIQMNNNRAYPKTEMSYQAIKLCDLLKSFAIKSKDTLEFIAADNFSVLIPAKYIMQCDKTSSIGYIAIEPTDKWPALTQYNSAKTAGPFDVIWVDPEKSNISDEYWAWSVVKIIVHKNLDTNLVPDMPLVKDEELRKQLSNGYNKYISHCAACHTINHIGKAVIGPDLNIPKNPVEYYTNDAVLKQFIRDPQSVRIKKYDRMSGSSKQFLSDADLADLITYFHFMSQHKVNSNQLRKI